MSLNFLHFSDIHFNHRHMDRWDPDEDLRREVLSDLERVTAKTGPADAVLITGDIAFSGQHNEYAGIRDWLGEVAELACHDPGAVLMVPGNHDVDLKVAASRRVTYLAQERIRDIPDDDLDQELEAALRDEVTGPSLLAPLAAYNAFAATFGCAITPGRPWWERQFTFGRGYELRMRGATSVLVSDRRDNDSDCRLAVPTQMVRLPKEPRTVGMLLAHHPREWMRRRDEIGDVLDARARIQLYGHRHVFRPRNEVGNLVVHAGATHPELGNDWWPHYNVLELDIVPEADSMILRASVYPRKWHPRETRFGVDTDPDGVDHRTFTLPLDDRAPVQPVATPPVSLGLGTGTPPFTVTTPTPSISPAQGRAETAPADAPAVKGSPATTVTGGVQGVHSHRDPKSSPAPANDREDAKRNTQNNFGQKTADASADAELQVPSILRLVDRPFDGDRRVTVSWQPHGSLSREATTTFTYQIDGSDTEKIRWYLEDYAEYPASPAPKIAAGAEARLSAIGRELFAAVFRTRETAGTWAAATSGTGRLTKLRFEVDADPTDVPGVPWEFLRVPTTDRPVALTAQEFVRTHHQTARPLTDPPPTADRLRVLLVICRPAGPRDVPYRSMASPLVRSGAEQMHGLDLDVLRPPTYKHLAQVLREAAETGHPYGVVHFDGHGAYLDVAALADDNARESMWGSLSVAGEIRPGAHGYLLFEDPTMASNQQLVDGTTLAALLAETDVPVVMLNACRSAYSEAGADAGEDGYAMTEAVSAEAGATGRTPYIRPPVVGDAEDDFHSRVRAFGSLAAEIADAGVPGVVAMRHNVYVVTAVQFAADLYAHLLAGKTLGQAATAARKALGDDPIRHIGYVPIALQDWVVPIIYESRRLALVARTSDRQRQTRIKIDLTRSNAMPAGTSRISGARPPRPPDLGFFGRDDTILALDRAFDTNRLVLLHGDAGMGKTATAAEFVRWYQITGALDYADLVTGPILWTSFEQHLRLSQVLDIIGAQLSEFLDDDQIRWQDVVDEETRRNIALQVLSQVPAIWVWDHVETIGSPADVPRGSAASEEHELADFLRDLKHHTRARVLLTSRRGKHTWLGNLPTRVAIPRMPMRESLQLAHAMIAREGDARAEPAALGAIWRPLLRYAGGNPAKVCQVVAQALSEDVTTSEQITEFVERLRAEEPAP